MIEKLIIGCANFSQPYNGYQVPAEEIEKIWEYCRKVGIDTVDTAVAYNYMPPKDFKIITKIRNGDIVFLPDYYAILAHRLDVWPTVKLLRTAVKVGLSIYEFNQLASLCWDDIDIVQLVYKKDKKRLSFLKAHNIKVHARKVFADNCFTEALLDPLVDKVVIGINNLAQLKQNVELAKDLEKEKEKICQR